MQPPYLFQSGSLPAGVAVAELKPHHVTRVMDGHAQTWPKNSENDFATDVPRAFDWAVNEGLINRSPLVKVGKPARERRE